MPRITGKAGALYLSEAGGAVPKIADIYNWECNLNSTPLNCSVKGDTLDRFVLSHGSGTITAERYIQTKATLSGYWNTTVAAGTRVQFVLWLVDASGTYSTVSGYGYITRADVSAPHAKATDRIEIQIDELTATGL
jgi:hypothetical protein